MKRKTNLGFALVKCKRNCRLLSLTAGVFIIFLLFVETPVFKNEISYTMEFDGFDNVTGADYAIVPNIIHFIYFNKTELNFIDYVVLRAAMRNHKPDKFYIHSNIPNVKLTGKYWEWIYKDVDLWRRIEFHYLELPSEIFGRKLRNWRVQHGSDIGRMRVLMKYGGIYLDNDVYVISNLDKYRKYEFVINWDENQFMGSQVLIAHKDARFLREWLETYREYNNTLWYYNAGERPTTEVLVPHPELIHRVKEKFGASIATSFKLYRDPKLQWRNLDAIHLLIRYRPAEDRKKRGEFNETNIQTYEFPFGEMAREVLGPRPC